MQTQKSDFVGWSHWGSQPVAQRATVACLGKGPFTVWALGENIRFPGGMKPTNLLCSVEDLEQ